MRSFGASESEIERWTKPDVADDWIWADCAASLELFYACDTQWRASFGGIIGLDYAAVAAIARARGRDLDARALADLRVIERAALVAMNRK